MLIKGQMDMASNNTQVDCRRGPKKGPPHQQQHSEPLIQAGWIHAFMFTPDSVPTIRMWSSCCGPSASRLNFLLKNGHLPSLVVKIWVLSFHHLKPVCPFTSDTNEPFWPRGFLPVGLFSVNSRDGCVKTPLCHHLNMANKYLPLEAWDGKRG